MADNTFGIKPDDIANILKAKMAGVGRSLADSFVDEVKNKAQAGGAGKTLAKSILSAGAVGTVTHAGASIVGQSAGSGAGGLAHAGASMTTGAVGAVGAGLSAAAAGAGPLGIAGAAAGVALAAVASAATSAVGALKEMAGAASPNGLKALDQAIQLFMGAVGTKILPVAIMFAAGLKVASDELIDDMLPGMDKTAKWYADNVDTFLAFGKAVVSITDWIVKSIGVVAGWIGKIAPNSEIGKAAKEASAGAQGYADAKKNADDPMGPPAPEGKGNRAGPAGGSSADKARSNFKETYSGMVKDMGAALAGKGGIGGIVDAWKKAQEAAMNGSMERDILKMQTSAVDYLRDINTKLDKANQRPDPIKR